MVRGGGSDFSITLGDDLIDETQTMAVCDLITNYDHISSSIKIVRQKTKN